MKNKRNILTLILALLSLYLPAQTWQFAKSFGGQGEYDNNKPHNLIVDSIGNAYVFGNYGALTAFNDSTLPFFYDGNRGSFLAKFNCSGEVEWAKSVSNSEQYRDQANYMILKDDYLYLHGTCNIDNWYKTWFLDTLVVGQLLVQNYPHNTVFPWLPWRSYTYIIKMDLDGNIIDYQLFSLYKEHAKGFYSTLWNDFHNKKPFMIDNENNYYILAAINGNSHIINLYHNGEVLINPLIYMYEIDYSQFILKFDSEFNLLWYKPIIYEIDNPNIEIMALNIFDMTCDTENNIYMVGYVKASTNQLESGEENLANISFGNNLTVKTSFNNWPVGFLAKMNSNGEFVWVQQSEHYGNDPSPALNLSFGEFKSLLLDNETNNIYVTGYAVQKRSQAPNTGTIFGGLDTLQAYFDPSTSKTGFFANYDTDGNYKWVRNVYSRQSQISSLSLYQDKLYATVRSMVNFYHDQIYEFSGGKGLNVCTWDRDGNPLEAINIPSTCTGSALEAFDTRVNSWGEIFITGTYDYGLTFGEHYIHGQGFKMFLAKYGKPCPYINNITANFCYGDEYNGTILTQTGDYQFILESSQEGTDSIINLNAIVNPQLVTGINDTTFCIGETYVLEANTNYNSYQWSTGSQTNIEELSFQQAGIENVYVSLTDDNCSGVDTIVITVEVCTSLAESFLNKLSLHPVPANAFIKVQLAEAEPIIAYSIFNLQGQFIHSEEVNKEYFLNIPVSNLKQGQYIIYIKTEKGVYSAGFVKD